ncbi:hypothetical protein JCM6882_002268 [Rhodosporidiobolus microsporus]
MAPRAFPARPLAGGPSTPFRTGATATAAGGRSTEAPMEYEYSSGRREFPASPFVAAAAGAAGDGEPARKRTHYEAMDVDTPPRPSTNFPPSATATSNPYGFGGADQPPPPPAAAHPLSFDAAAFKPEQAFGLEDAVETNEVSMADEAEELVREIREEEDGGAGKALALRAGGGGARRRKASSSSRRGGKGRSAGTDDDTASEGDGDGDGGEGGEGGFLGVLKSKVGRRAGDGQFSFQVHHHHAPSYGGMGSPALSSGPEGHAQHGAAPEKWLKSGTPYVLLGYLQFGSLTLLAVLVLSLLLLFLYTLYNDILTRLSSLTLELRAEILQCAKSYVDNRCAPETRLPAMESRCAAWEECMNREVVVGGKTRVVAETLAEVVNGFVDVISFKTMLFVLLTLFLTIYGSSVALSILPSRSSTAPPPSPSAPSFAHPHHASAAAALGYGAPPGYPPYGLPYGPGTGWVVDSQGGGREGAGGGKEGLGVGAVGA